jgi:hypothetical protein
MPDTFKLPNHITFSDQSMYHGKDGNEGGRWSKLADDRWSFTPSMTNLENHSLKEMQDYFKKYEPGNILNVKLAQDYTKNISDVGEKYGVRPEVLTKQLHAESNFDPLTGKYDKTVSKAGAEGPAQFLPETAKQYGVNVKDIASSIEGQGKYMSELQKQFKGSEGLALAAYNWGPKNVKDWVAAGADPGRIPKETRDYVQKITGKPIEDWTHPGEEGANNIKDVIKETRDLAAKGEAPDFSKMRRSTNVEDVSGIDLTTRHVQFINEYKEFLNKTDEADWEIVQQQLSKWKKKENTDPKYKEMIDHNLAALYNRIVDRTSPGGEERTAKTNLKGEVFPGKPYIMDNPPIPRPRPKEIK